MLSGTADSGDNSHNRTHVLVTNVKIYRVYVLQRYTNLEDAFVQNNLNVSPMYTH